MRPTLDPSPLSPERAEAMALSWTWGMALVGGQE